MGRRGFNLSLCQCYSLYSSGVWEYLCYIKYTLKLKGKRKEKKRKRERRDTPSHDKLSYFLPHIPLHLAPQVATTILGSVVVAFRCPEYQSKIIRKEKIERSTHTVSDQKNSTG